MKPISYYPKIFCKSLILTIYSGFSNWGWLVGWHFGQNGEKLHENCEIILGQNSRGHMGGQNPPPPPPPKKKKKTPGISLF